ncbi:MAG: hypothetical protein O7C59_05890 [Rickettsia endosymbiont of Ixodes persulcatus]|nr:hypothetical protein [Rickettsia endosymbiont of Ixodes persulcatus]
MENKKLALIILDGWGYGNKDKSDAAYAANTPFFDSLLAKYPNSKLEAYFYCLLVYHHYIILQLFRQILLMIYQHILNLVIQKKSLNISRQL